MISGGEKPGLFKSKDLREWKYLGDVIDKDNTLHDALDDLSKWIYSHIKERDGPHRHNPSQGRFG